MVFNFIRLRPQVEYPGHPMLDHHCFRYGYGTKFSDFMYFLLRALVGGGGLKKSSGRSR